MDRIRFSFPESDQMISRMKKAEHRCEALSRQILDVMRETESWGESDFPREVTDSLRRQHRRCGQLSEQIASLRAAMERVRQLFADTEKQLAGTAEQSAGRIRNRPRPAAQPRASVLTEMRFSDMLYPDWFSQAARKHFNA